MTTVGRVGAGAALGILAASLATPLMGFFHSGYGHLMLLVLPLVLIAMTILAGPGAFLLAWVHAVRMGDWAPKARTIGQIRKVGVLLALPLGVANLVLVFGILTLCNGRTIPLMEVAPWLIPALAGGAGLGWGVTFGLTPGRAAPARTTARPRPTRKIRRDGPPFFDKRASREHRRAA